jgi:hypothetical protein
VRVIGECSGIVPCASTCSTTSNVNASPAMFTAESSRVRNSASATMQRGSGGTSVIAFAR